MLAHIKKEEDQFKYQTIKEHSINVARYSEEILSSVGLAKTGYLAGILHDMGKCKKKFQNYLIHGGGSVIHTFQGLKYCIERIDTSSNNPYLQLTNEIIAYVIGAHHGLFDVFNEDDKCGIDYRCNREDIDYQECKANFENQIVCEEAIDKMFENSEKEIFDVIKRILKLSDKEQDEFNFYISLLCRQILSAVIFSDHRDTSEFDIGEKKSFIKTDLSIWKDISQSIENKISNFDKSSEINKARDWISNKCKENARLPNSIYKLNVPTGGGKTLSVLMYAVNHAKYYNADRIILVSPLLSILDQNAKVIREAVGNDDFILEHHSNVVRDTDDIEIDIKLEDLKEKWDVPIIITTLVQLLNTMFASGSSNIKRFSALSNSIIVIDEIQSLPSKVISMFNLTCNYLAKICNTTIVLCSATQPTLENVNHKLISPIKDLVPYNENIWKAFERTKLIDAGFKDENELVSFVLDSFKTKQSVLLICNTKKEAEVLFQQIHNQVDDETTVYHLSAAMCQQHRKDVISNLKEDLKERKKLIMISTQVMEAGVDVSFSMVIRITAGMDNIIQAAGRCNRNHESNNLSEVYIVTLKEEQLGSLKDIKISKIATLALLDDFNKNENKYSGKLDSKEAINRYYLNYFGDKDRKSELDYPRSSKNYGTLFDLLSTNEQYANENVETKYDWVLRQAFRTAGSEFKVFDENTIDVIVPYKKGKEIIEKIIRNGKNIEENKDFIGKAKSFCVSLYDEQYNSLSEQNAIYSINDCLYLLEDDRFYDENLGVVLHSDEKLDLLEV